MILGVRDKRYLVVNKQVSKPKRMRKEVKRAAQDGRILNAKLVPLNIVILNSENSSSSRINHLQIPGSGNSNLESHSHQAEQVYQRLLYYIQVVWNPVSETRGQFLCVCLQVQR